MDAVEFVKTVNRVATFINTVMSARMITMVRAKYAV